MSLDDPESQEELAARIVAEGLSVRATEEEVTLQKSAGKSKKKAARKKTEEDAPSYDWLAERLADRLDTRVKVERSRRKGRIVIDFGSADDLRRLAELILDEDVRDLGDQ